MRFVWRTFFLNDEEKISYDELVFFFSVRHDIRITNDDEYSNIRHDEYGDERMTNDEYDDENGDERVTNRIRHVFVTGS